MEAANYQSPLEGFQQRKVRDQKRGWEQSVEEHRWISKGPGTPSFLFALRSLWPPQLDKAPAETSNTNARGQDGGRACGSDGCWLGPPRLCHFLAV